MDFITMKLLDLLVNLNISYSPYLVLFVIAIFVPITNKLSVIGPTYIFYFFLPIPHWASTVCTLLYYKTRARIRLLQGILTRY